MFCVIVKFLLNLSKHRFFIKLGTNGQVFGQKMQVKTAFKGNL